MNSTEYIDCYQNGNKLQRIRVFKIYSMHRFEVFFFYSPSYSARFRREYKTLNF